MSGNTMIKVMRSTFFALGLVASAVCSAHGGGGGWHGGGGGWHGGGWHGGGWHGGGWHGGGWHGGGWHGGGWNGVGWGGVVIGAPYGGYYYDSGCQTIRVCNRYGHCWLQESCY